MIESLRIEGFKNFRNVEVQLGPWNLFIGANASGKSNLFEVLRVFQGLALEYRVEEIFDGAPKSARGDSWDGIRGGLAHAGFFFGDRISLGAKGGFLYKDTSYDLTISTISRLITGQKLVIEGEEAPTDVATDLVGHFDFANTVKPDLFPYVLRQYSSPQEVRQIGERGENFAAVVDTILKDPQAAAAYQSWLEQLTPKEFERVKILRGALNEPMFALEQHGKVFPAPTLSDGTLRFAALAATFFQPDPPSYLILEDIENGIHPSRLRLLVEMFRQLSSPQGTQVFASTHSPAVLDWLSEDDLRHTFLCVRDEDTGASVVRSLASIPNFRDSIREHSAGELFTEGWMEIVG